MNDRVLQPGVSPLTVDPAIQASKFQATTLRQHDLTVVAVQADTCKPPRARRLDVSDPHFDLPQRTPLMHRRHPLDIRRLVLFEIIVAPHGTCIHGATLALRRYSSAIWVRVVVDAASGAAGRRVVATCLIVSAGMSFARIGCELVERRERLLDCSYSAVCCRPS
jgi:hypothetical protein